MCGAKRIHRITYAKQQEAVRINSKFKKAGCRKLAEFEGGKILPDPEQAFTRGHAGGESAHETGCRRFMADCGKNFMQHAALKPALQAEIGGGMAERNADCGLLQSRPGEGSPEGRYFVAVHETRKEQNRNTVKQTMRDCYRNLKLLVEIDPKTPKRPVGGNLPLRATTLAPRGENPLQGALNAFKSLLKVYILSSVLRRTLPAAAPRPRHPDRERP